MLLLHAEVEVRADVRVSVLVNIFFRGPDWTHTKSWSVSGSYLKLPCLYLLVRGINFLALLCVKRAHVFCPISVNHMLTMLTPAFSVSVFHSLFLYLFLPMLLPHVFVEGFLGAVSFLDTRRACWARTSFHHQ